MVFQELAWEQMLDNSPLVAVNSDIEGATGGERLLNIIPESERLRAAVVGAAGLRRIDANGERTVDVPIAMLLTDRRIVFAAVSSGGLGPADDARSIPYKALAGIDLAGGRLEFTTTGGVTWSVGLPAADGAAEDAIARDLLWIGRVRSRVVAVRNDVDLAAGRIDEAAEGRAWSAGVERYTAARRALDELVQAVDLTEPVADGALAPELSDIERALERAYTNLVIGRAQSRLTLGQQLMENGDVEQASEVLETAHEDYAAAERHATALERGDMFRFGEQRTIETRLKRLGWEMEAVAAEPLRQAHEAKMLAQSTRDTDATVAHWERAFHRFGTALALDWGDEDRYVGHDRERVREELSNAAGQLLAIHQTLARTSWDAGVEHHAAGETKPAIRQLESAIDHLERAHDLAGQFRPSAAAEMARRLESMREGRRRVRFHGSPDESSQSEAEPVGQSTREMPAAISPSELSEMDSPGTASADDEPDTVPTADEPDPVPTNDEADEVGLVLDPGPEDPA